MGRMNAMKMLRRLFGKPPSKFGEEIEVTGDWMKEVWTKQPLKVYADPDAVAAFLTQSRLPPLWPRDKKYVRYLKEEDDAQKIIRLSWITAYLNHPNSRAVLKTLRDHIPKEIFNTLGLTNELTDLLLHPEEEVRHEAAKCIWETNADLDIVLNILGSRGLIPSGIAPSEGRRAAETLRTQCPPERRQLFDPLMLDTFGRD